MIERLSVAHRPFINSMIYGPPGVGKTTLCASAAAHPDMKELLICDIDGGTMSIDPEALTWLKEMPLYRRIANISELEEVHWAIVRGSEEYADVKTVLVDTSTELAIRDLEQTVGKQLKPGSKRVKAGQTIDDPWPEDHGMAGRRVARVIRWLKDAPVNLIVTAHSQELYPKEDTRKGRRPDFMKTPLEVAPDLPPSLRRKVTGFMDYVWHLRIHDDERYLITQPRGPYFAKTRGPGFAERLGPVIHWSGIDDPLMARIYQCLVDPNYRISEEEEENMPKPKEETPEIEDEETEEEETEEETETDE